jgi:hypothetical protein
MRWRRDDATAERRRPQRLRLDVLVHRLRFRHPQGFPSGGPGGGFSDPQVQSALTACGITLTRPSGAASGAPSS